MSDPDNNLMVVVILDMQYKWGICSKRKQDRKQIITKKCIQNNNLIGNTILNE